MIQVKLSVQTAHSCRLPFAADAGSQLPQDISDSPLPSARFPRYVCLNFRYIPSRHNYMDGCAN